MDFDKAVQRSGLGHMATVSGNETIRAHLAHSEFASFDVPEGVISNAAQLLIYGSGDEYRAIRVLDSANQIIGEFGLFEVEEAPEPTDDP